MKRQKRREERLADHLHSHQKESVRRRVEEDNKMSDSVQSMTIVCIREREREGKTLEKYPRHFIRRRRLDRAQGKIRMTFFLQRKIEINMKIRYFEE